MKEKFTDRFWPSLIVFFMIFFVALALYPFLFVLSESFSDNSFVERGLVVLFPIGFNFESWIVILKNAAVIRPVITTALVTVLGTFSSLLITIFLAYPTSKPGFKLTKIISVGVVFTMILKPPMIPYFLTLRTYGMINNPLVLILPHTVIAYNYFVIRTFLKQTPISLEESALIDGANQYQILFKIILPVSKAALATIALFYAVLIWNQFYHPKLFLLDDKFITIQIFLRQILDRASEMETLGRFMDTNARYGSESINAAAIIFLTLPIICVYPFVQKHFVKGATLGAIKG